jgi:hypothetical protein
MCGGYEVPWLRFTKDAWSLEPPTVDELMQKIRDVGVPLKDFAGVSPLYGIKTGFNEAFLINPKPLKKRRKFTTTIHPPFNPAKPKR